MNKIDLKEDVIKNGDLVTYERCFGETICTFIGMVEGLNYTNDCAIVYNGNVVPANFSDLKKHN